MNNKKLQTILTQHSIPLACWPEMRALVFDGARPSIALLRRLHNVSNYAAALQSIVIELSRKSTTSFLRREIVNSLRTGQHSNMALPMCNVFNIVAQQSIRNFRGNLFCNYAQKAGLSRLFLCVCNSLIPLPSLGRWAGTGYRTTARDVRSAGLQPLLLPVAGKIFRVGFACGSDRAAPCPASIPFSSPSAGPSEPSSPYRLLADLPTTEWHSKMGVSMSQGAESCSARHSSPFSSCSV